MCLTLIEQEKTVMACFRKDDPNMLAFAYTAPITALIHLCDREPEKTEEAIRQVETFSRHFIKTYGTEGIKKLS